MNYIIVNNSTFDDFFQKAAQLAAAGHSVSLAYLEQADDHGVVIPGSWGCIRFAGELPVEPIFLEPDLEYRYSASADAWLVNGEPTERSDWIKVLLDYFVSGQWGSP